MLVTFTSFISLVERLATGCIVAFTDALLDVWVEVTLLVASVAIVGVAVATLKVILLGLDSIVVETLEVSVGERVVLLDVVVEVILTLTVPFTSTLVLGIAVGVTFPTVALTVIVVVILPFVSTPSETIEVVDAMPTSTVVVFGPTWIVVVVSTLGRTVVVTFIVMLRDVVEGMMTD